MFSVFYTVEWVCVRAGSSLPIGTSAPDTEKFVQNAIYIFVS